MPERNESNADLIACYYRLIVTMGAIQKIIMNAQSKHLLISFVLLLSDQCDSCISPENGGFDVRWVRFPKHIHSISTLSQLELGGFRSSSDWVQRAPSEKDEFFSCYLDESGRNTSRSLLVAGVFRLR